MRAKPFICANLFLHWDDESRRAMSVRAQPARLGRGPWFLVALLLALASALVPALAPVGGSAPARMLGSAFDPSNDVKTLRVREQQVMVAASAVEDGSRDSATGPAPALAAGAAHEAPLAAQTYPASLSVTSGFGPAASPRLRGAAQPRAPPALRV